MQEPDDTEGQVAEQEDEDNEFDAAFEKEVEAEEGDPDKSEAGTGEKEEKAEAGTGEADVEKLDMDGLKKHIEDHPNLGVEVAEDATEDDLRKAITDAAPAEEKVDLAKLDLDGLKKHVEEDKDLKGKIEVTDETTEEELRKAIEDSAESDEDKTDRERGEKLIQDEEARKRAAGEKEAADAKAKEEAEAKAGPAVLGVDQAKTFSDFITEDELPDVIEIEGQEIKLKEYLNDFPEATIIAGFQTQKILQRLIDNNTLPTVNAMRQLESNISEALFDLRVLGKVPDAQEIVDSDKYKTWAGGATPETKALLKSENPADFVKALHKFKRSVARKVSKKKPDKEKARKHKEHSDLHSSTLRQRGKTGETGGGSAGEDDFDGAFEEALKEKDDD